MVFVSSISFLHSRMMFSNTSFSWINVCSGCPVIPVKAAVAASFFSFTDAATAFSALATFSSLVAPRNSAAWTSHNFCTVSSGVPPCRSSCSACMISAGSTALNSFAKSALTFSNSSPALSRSRYVLICSTRLLCSMILSFPIYIDSLTNSFFILPLQYTQKQEKNMLLQPHFIFYLSYCTVFAKAIVSCFV